MLLESGESNHSLSPSRLRTNEETRSDGNDKYPSFFSSLFLCVIDIENTIAREDSRQDTKDNTTKVTFEVYL